MKRTIVFILSVMLAFTFSSCKKNNSDGANIFYGKWSKGTNWGDTLFFYQKNDKNIMAYNYSFNPAIPALTEVQYAYKNEKLIVEYYGISNSFKTIESFKWKQFGNEFEIQGIEFYSFMSSTQVYFTYHKLQ